MNKWPKISTLGQTPGWPRTNPYPDPTRDFSYLASWVMVHRQIAFFMNWLVSQKGEGYEYRLLALALAIVIIIRGAGAFSVDRALSSKSAA